MVHPAEIAEKIYMIDDQLYSIPQYGSVYLLNEEKKALVDSGPSTSAGVVLDGIRESGVSPEDIDYLTVTHIHSDHDGGVGLPIKNMPKAQVLVHHRRAKHLIGPSKLVSSALAAQDGVEEGLLNEAEILPIEVERVRPVYDGDVIELGEQQVLRIIEAPGHAPHELCIYESRNSGVFAGDAASSCVGENKTLVMVNPTPSFNADLSIDTLKRLMELKASRIYFTYFGMSCEVQQKLQLAMDALQAWDDIISESVRANELDGVAERLLIQAGMVLEPPRKEWPLLYEYLAKHNMPMSVEGYLKYYQDEHGVELDKRRNGESNQRENRK
jgi:glyoxylase-like metal-dependent hydrolase (beta-lactamase superfamily II)